MKVSRWLKEHHPIRWTLLIAVLVAAGITLAPKASESLDSLHQLHGAAYGWLGVSLAGEIASLWAFSLVTSALVSRASRPRFSRVVRVDLVTVALSHAVPAGSVAGTALGYELLADEGVGAVESGFVKVSQSLLSGVLLQVLLGIALLLKIMVYGPSAANIGLAAVGAFMMVMLGGFVWLLIWHQHVIATLAIHLLGWLPKLTPQGISDFTDDLARRMHELIIHPRRFIWVCVWSMGNWVFDLLSLWGALKAFGHTPNLVLVTVAFSVAQVVATIPISPAGLGVVEGSLVPILVSFGSSSSAAVLGVLTWRLFNFWLPLPAGVLAYVSILIDRRRGRLPGPPDRKRTPNSPTPNSPTPSTNPTPA